MSDFVVDSIALLSFIRTFDVGPSKVANKAFVPMSRAFFNFVACGS
jgi:hypothetical protein